MVCANEIYEWFKELAVFNRIDFLCSLMQLCLPSELRFIGTYLDDMNNKDYANLRESEDRSNSPNEFSKFPLQPFDGPSIRKLCLSLSLLKSTNQKVAQIIYEILQIHSEFSNECVISNNEFRNEVLLLYALASYHPAFTFENRYKLGKHFNKMLSNSRKPFNTYSNENNSCCYKIVIGKDSFRIGNVKIENGDAEIILEISTKQDSSDSVTKRITKFSKIMDLFNNVYKYGSDETFDKLKLDINKLNNNGYFTNKNLIRFLEKVFKFIESNQTNENVKNLKNFFLQQPTFYNKTSIHLDHHIQNPCFELLADHTEETINIEKPINYFLQSNSMDYSMIEEHRKTQLTKISPCASETCKSTATSSPLLPEDSLCSELLSSDVNSPLITEVNSFCVTKKGNINENIDEAKNDNSNNTSVSESNIYQDCNPNVPVFQYYLQPYSVFTSGGKPQYPLFHHQPIDQLPHSGHPSSSGKMNAYLLTHFSQLYLPFNTQISSFVPVLCPLNQSINFNATPAPINEAVSYEVFPSPRLTCSLPGTAQNIANSPCTISKLPSSASATTPPRMRAIHQKSITHSSNFSASS